jgi:hypothetical protein
MRNTIIGFVTLAVVLALTLFAASAYAPTIPDSSTVHNADDVAIRALVTDFGTTLQNVSLFASDRADAMQQHYAAYISPELLAAWISGDPNALGRHSSSPWPDSIEVVEVRTSGERYVVEANVIEVANASDRTEPAAVYPVTLTLEKRGGTWMITRAEKGAHSELPRRQSIVGYWECLPHKDRTGPQTMECAFGVAVDQSDGHYAVDTSLMSTYPVDFATGAKVRVTGIVTPANQLSSIQKYDIDGIIRATTIEKI